MAVNAPDSKNVLGRLLTALDKTTARALTAAENAGVLGPGTAQALNYTAYGAIPAAAVYGVMRGARDQDYDGVPPAFRARLASRVTELLTEKLAMPMPAAPPNSPTVDRTLSALKRLLAAGALGTAAYQLSRHVVEQRNAPAENNPPMEYKVRIY